MNEFVNMIKACGYKVYMRKPSDTWCYYTNGTDIAYCQWSGFRGASVSTVHRPNTTTGTSFHIADNVSPETIRAALHCYVPSWASNRYLAATVKWSSWAAFHKADKFNSEYVEI